MSAAKPAEKPHTKDDQAPVRKQLIALLRGGQAHATFDEAVKDLPANLRSVVPENLPYSAWQLLEHLRIAQLDILNFSAPPTGGYQHIKWPDDYWPKSPKPSLRTSWDHPSPTSAPISNASKSLIENPAADLYKPFRWGDGQNLLREAMLLADHNAYHLGELVVLRRLLGRMAQINSPQATNNERTQSHPRNARYHHCGKSPHHRRHRPI